MTGFRSVLLVSALSAVLIGGGAALAEDLPGAGKTVVASAQANDPQEMFQTYLVGMGLQELGYKVEEPVVAQLQPALLAVANGDTQFYPAFWDPLHNSFLDAIGKDKVQLVGGVVENSIQGYLIDKKTADAYGIKTIEQLKDPKIASMFATEADGKATLYGCDPGWGCERVIEHHLDAYGLRNTITHKQGSYSAIIGDAIERIKSGKPTLYYTWTPLWLSSVLEPGKNVSWLTVEKTELPGEQISAKTTVPGIGNVGFSVNNQKVLVNSEWLKDNPAAAKWFELVKIPIEDINAENNLMHQGEDKNADIMRHAEAWKAAHKKQWDEWIATAKAAK